MKPTVTCTYEEFKELQDTKDSYEKLVNFIHNLRFEQINQGAFFGTYKKMMPVTVELVNADDVLYKMQQDLPSLIGKAIEDLYK